MVVARGWTMMGVGVAIMGIISVSQDEESS